MGAKVIIVADSNSSQNQLLSIQLKKLDFEPIQVFALDDLLSAVRSRKYALLLIEATMNAKCAEAIRTIREEEASEGFARTPIIAISKNQNDETLMIQAGCDEFLKRPIEQRKLKLVIQSWCS